MRPASAFEISARLYCHVEQHVHIELRDLTSGERDKDIARAAADPAKNGYGAAIIFKGGTNERVLRVDGTDRILQLLSNNPLPMTTTDDHYRHHATPPQHPGGGGVFNSKEQV
jgi:hypothetical protein